MKIGDEVLIHGYIDEIRYDHTKRVSTVIIRNEGGYFGTVEHEVTDIEMPNTIKILNKIWLEIKAEKIENIKKVERTQDGHHAGVAIGLQEALDIIDKYINSEDKE